MAYHYTECGLDDIWLNDGVTIEQHPDYGEIVSIHNVEKLHRAIALDIVNAPKRMTGAEFRFLRREMDMSQRVLAKLIGMTEQAVSLWERARHEPVPNPSAERLIRLLYLESTGNNVMVRALIERMIDIDAELSRIEAAQERHLALANDDWKMAA